MTVSGTAILIVGGVLAAWLVAAVWALWSGLALRRSSRAVRRQLKRLSQILDSSPALPLIVRSDGKIEGPVRIAKWLGLDSLPAYLADLSQDGAGLTSTNLAELSGLVAATQKSGRGFLMSLRALGSAKALRIEGYRDDSQSGVHGGVLLWFYDATQSEVQITELADQAAEARRAFSALTGLIEAAPIPMWFRNDELRLILVNSAYVASVGAADADQVIREGIELVETVDGLTPMAAAARALQRGEAIHRVVSTTIAGERRAMEIVDLPIPKRGIAGYAIDIHDLEEARQDIDRFREAQRDMLDNLSAGVAQFDSQRQLIFSNQPFQRMFALKPQWVADGTEFDRMLDRMRETDRIPQVRDFLAWRAERGGWFQAPSAQQENWLLPDGTHLRAIAQPTPDNGLLLVFEDRTEQVQLAQARDTLLRARTATFNNLFEALAVFTSDGRLHLWNNRFASIWDIDEAELAEHPRVDVLLKKLAPGLKTPSEVSALREVIRAATLDRVQRTGQLEMGDGKFYDFVGIPLPDANALFTMIDVTDAKKIEQALRDRNAALVEADAVKTRFLANMSYEFRTPLTSIGGFAEMLAGGAAGPLSDQASDYVKAILESVERLSGQINNVLDLSQTEAGNLPLKLERAELLPLLEQVVISAADFAASRSISLQADLSEQLGAAEVDPSRFSQAVSAVLDNALRYTQVGGQVQLSADRYGDRPRIVISDNGPGLAADEQVQALGGFVPGEEGDSIQDRRSGIGLALARNLIEAQGGTFSLLSKPGVGTVVTMALP